MPSFLKDITKFYGTGERNAAGQTLPEFLETYDPHRYETPSCTTDAVIFAYSGVFETLDDLKVLLIKRSNHPCIGFWALPGGFADMRENLSETARRELMEETGVEGLIMEQIGTFGDYDRDPRSRVITTAYMALVDENDVKVHAGDDAADAVWCRLHLQLEKTEMKNGKVRNLYSLHIQNATRALDTTALVERTESIGVIKETDYKVLDMGMIAADHAAILVNALVILGRRLPEI